MLPRLRRLIADHHQVQAAFRSHPFIQCTKAEGNPPERYWFDLAVPGLVPGEQTDQVVVGAHHCAEVFLPTDYPRRPPFCRMLSPVFHPNIDPQKICIGDHWGASQSLAQLVVRIAEMICFQSYNTKSPLNARAAAWAEENIARLPLLRADIGAGL